MYYALNKANSRTKNTKPTLTDQSAAQDTDRNVIVKKFMVTSQVPAGRPGFYANLAELPEDLRGFINQARSLQNLRGNLPPELRNLSLNDILALTPEQLRDKLKKPEPPAKPQGDNK